MPMTNFELGKNVLNKIAWSADGKRIAVGDNTGKLSIMNIDKELYNSKLEDSNKFEKAMNIAKNNSKKSYYN